MARVPVSYIKAVCAQHFGITVQDIEGGRRAHSRPRQVAMALANEFSSLPYSALAKFFKRGDHTTIIYGNLVAREKYAADLEELRGQIIAHVPLEPPPPKPELEEEPPVIVAEPVEARATSFTPRKFRPARIIQPVRAGGNVTGEILGDPGYASLRVMRGEKSKGVT